MYEILKVLGIRRKTKESLFIYLHYKTLQGFPLATAKRVQRIMKLSDPEFARLLAISVNTLQRMKKEQRRLSTYSGDRLFRLAYVIVLAEKVFENKDAARNWITHAQPGLGQYRPLELIETYAGYEEVKNLLSRMEHGVYT